MGDLRATPANTTTDATTHAATANNTKKPYQQPSLAHYGDVAQLVQGSGSDIDDIPIGSPGSLGPS